MCAQEIYALIASGKHTLARGRLCLCRDSKAERAPRGCSVCRGIYFPSVVPMRAHDRRRRVKLGGGTEIYKSITNPTRLVSELVSVKILIIIALPPPYYREPSKVHHRNPSA